MQRLEKRKQRQIQKAIQDYAFKNYKDDPQPSIFTVFYQQKEQHQMEDIQKQTIKPQQRLTFKKLTFNETTVQKHQISLSFTKRKDEEIQFSFEIQGRKFKLITTSDKQKTSITNRQGLRQIQISAESAIEIEYRSQKQKKIEINKNSFEKITIKCNYNYRNYDPNKIELFFVYHECNYRLLHEPLPLQQPKFMGQSCLLPNKQFQFSMVDFDLPIDTDIDWPVYDLLQGIIDPPCPPQTDNVFTQQLNSLNAITVNHKLNTPTYLQTKFRSLTPQEQEETYQERLAITRLKKKQKFNIINNIFKIKDVDVRDYPPYSKPKCINQCKINFNNYKELRLHLSTHHPKLVQLGITVDKKCRYICSQRALDYVLILGRLFPKAMKKAIKETKTRPS